MFSSVKAYRNKELLIRAEIFPYVLLKLKGIPVALLIGLLCLPVSSSEEIMSNYVCVCPAPREQSLFLRLL